MSIWWVWVKGNIRIDDLQWKETYYDTIWSVKIIKKHNLHIKTKSFSTQTIDCFCTKRAHRCDVHTMPGAIFAAKRWYTHWSAQTPWKYVLTHKVTCTVSSYVCKHTHMSPQMCVGTLIHKMLGAIDCFCTKKSSQMCVSTLVHEMLGAIVAP